MSLKNLIAELSGGTLLPASGTEPPEQSPQETPADSSAFDSGECLASNEGEQSADRCGPFDEDADRRAECKALAADPFFCGNRWSDPAQYDIFFATSNIGRIRNEKRS